MVRRKIRDEMKKVKLINVRREGSRIYADVQDKYQVSYSPSRDDYICDCMGFTITENCKHIKELKNVIEVLKSSKGK